METVNGSIQSLGEKLTSVGEAFDGKLVAFQQDFDGKLKTVNQTLDGKLSTIDETLNTKLKSVDQSLNSKLDTVNQALSGKLDTADQTFSGKLDTVNQDLSGKLDQVQKDLEAKTESAVSEVASTTVKAMQELTSKTESGLSSLHDEVAQQQQSLKDETTAQFAQVQETFVNFDKGLANTHKLATRGQREWILAEVEYLLRSGGHRVNLAGDTKSAVYALRAASDRLHDLGDARYSPVRDQIAEEVAELRQVGMPDIEGIAFELQKLSKRADTLPLPPSGVERVVAQVKEDPTELDARDVADQLFQSLKSLVKTEKSDGTPLVRPGKPTRKQLSASEALRLNLQGARLSVLRRDQQTYSLQMENTVKYVQESYDLDNNLTKAYLEDLAVLEVQKIVPSVSKLGQALTLFNEIHSKRGEK